MCAEHGRANRGCRRGVRTCLYKDLCTKNHLHVVAAWRCGIRHMRSGETPTHILLNKMAVCMWLSMHACMCACVCLSVCVMRAHFFPVHVPAVCSKSKKPTLRVRETNIIVYYYITLAEWTNENTLGRKI